ncbi:MAG: zf-HC2 domain-containing protein [Syntrophales bacterium]|jgi:hypothetical protein|nr:zf-HC2 domain-containing protein [Syntrophales bacterium]MCK9390790.1 zf-HC2 domain-containing protein [Syntrophales bacterium]
MTCNEIENRLSAYMEGLLPPGEKKDTEEHLATCPRCRQALSDLKQVEKLVKGLEEVEPPLFFEHRIMSLVREEAGQKQGFLRRIFHPLYIKVPVQVLATLLIAVLGFYVFQKGDPAMKQMAPLPLPMAESRKVLVPDESPRGTSHPAVVKPAPQQSAGDLPGDNRRPFAPPPPGSGGKADRNADVQAPTGKDYLSGPSPAVPAIQSREMDIPTTGAATSGRVRDRAEKRESGQSPETLVLEQKRKVKVTDPDVKVTIYVEDTSVALKKIEDRLGQVNARIMDREHREGKELMNAAIPPHNIAAFLERIEGIGRVSMEKRLPAVPDRHITIRIEIVARP